ncbi:hypothetical protein RF11_01528 [Thelohanellus kitauei]|uniref:Uncharacterized protein n=1 Tax=Thelohanellus kitauei TaxID=669202 RepID=A0A0C2IU76_THEKT|nr:hypothetical protein RF11_01528 [Thelohanellus kitauei]
MHDLGRSSTMIFSKLTSSSGLIGSYKSEEIVETMMCRGECVESEDEDISVEKEVVWFKKGQRALSTVLKFVEGISRISCEIEACDQLNNEMQVFYQKKVRHRRFLRDQNR